MVTSEPLFEESDASFVRQLGSLLLSRFLAMSGSFRARLKFFDGEALHVELGGRVLELRLLSEEEADKLAGPIVERLLAGLPDPTVEGFEWG